MSREASVLTEKTKALQALATVRLNQSFSMSLKKAVRLGLVSITEDTHGKRYVLPTDLGVEYSLINKDIFITEIFDSGASFTAGGDAN